MSRANEQRSLARSSCCWQNVFSLIDEGIFFYQDSTSVRSDLYRDSSSLVRGNEQCSEPLATGEFFAKIFHQSPYKAYSSLTKWALSQNFRRYRFRFIRRSNQFRKILIEKSRSTIFDQWSSICVQVIKVLQRHSRSTSYQVSVTTFHRSVDEITSIRGSCTRLHCFLHDRKCIYGIHCAHTRTHTHTYLALKPYRSRVTASSFFVLDLALFKDLAFISLRHSHNLVRITECASTGITRESRYPVGTKEEFLTGSHFARPLQLSQRNDAARQLHVGGFPTNDSRKEAISRTRAATTIPLRALNMIN